MRLSFDISKIRLERQTEDAVKKKTKQNLYEEIVSSFTVIDFIINARSNHITRLHLGESCIIIALSCAISVQSQLRNFGIGLALFVS